MLHPSQDMNPPVENSVSTLDARVTVGVVVYNGALTLRRAVESVLNQSYQNFTIHISDDGSRDDTPQIGRSLAAEHGRIVFTRQPGNLGPANNFRFLLEQADTEYFMWLAADDYLEPTYLERMITILDGGPSLVASVSRVRFVKPDGSTRVSGMRHPLIADPVTNLAVYLTEPHENGLYAVYHTSPMQKAFPQSHFHGYDWAAVAGTLLYGKHTEVPEVLMVRDDTPKEHYVKSVRVDNHSRLTRLFPLAPVTYDLLVRQRIPIEIGILKALISQNMDHHLRYMQMFHPRYMKITRHIWRAWYKYLSPRLVQDHSHAR
jgi:glycosyltransferase involved in cell wall biosynthesis